MRTTEIKFTVTFDDNNIPEKIEWSAPESKGEHFTKSLMVAFWDANERNSLRLDLWTKKMMVDEMTQFYEQNLLAMGDAFERATGNKKGAAAIREVADRLGEKQDSTAP